MKKRIAAALLATMLVMLCAGCAAKEDRSAAPPEAPDASAEQTAEQPQQPAPEAEPPKEPEEPDYLAVYAPVLDEICDVLYNGLDDGKEYPNAPSGVIEMAMWMERGELTASVGWKLTDISGDGVPELLVGTLRSERSEAEQPVVFGGWTCRDGEPVCFLDGWGRNSYQWMGGGRFYHFGSGGAAYSSFGSYQVTPDGTELSCEDFYFTEPKKDDDYDVCCYHNTTGAWDSAQAEELDIDSDAFWKLSDELAAQCVDPELLPFSDYEYTGPVGGSVVRADYLEDVQGRLAQCEDLSAKLPDGGANAETTVVFRAVADVKDFKLLALELRGVGDDGHADFAKTEVLSLPELRAGEAVSVPMSFPGDIPSNGFSYVAADGAGAAFTLSMSGYDGSLVTAPLD